MKGIDSNAYCRLLADKRRFCYGAAGTANRPRYGRPRHGPN